MSYCPICGGHHDPSLPCTDRAGELLRGAGIHRKRMPRKELKKTIKKANLTMAIILIAFLSLLVLAVLITKLIEK